MTVLEQHRGQVQQGSAEASTAYMRHLRERDGGRCAYTERLLKPEECSMEHVVPRSKGGPTEWKNVVLADKRINNLRGNRSLKEAGLTLKIQPTVPTAKPFHESLRNQLKFPEWEFFARSRYGFRSSTRRYLVLRPPPSS